MACMMIASKTEEVAYIRIKSFLKNIAFGKFTMKQILETELEILSVIDFRVNFPTIHDISSCAFRFVKFEDKRVEVFF